MAGSLPFGRRPAGPGAGPDRPGAGPDRPADVFVGGLLAGALVGAVIAGSAIWERRRRRRLADPGGGTPGPDPGSVGRAAVPEAPESQPGA
jgi:hypothetical protein